MEHYQPREILEIKNIIQFGNRKPEDYQISFYKEVYGLNRTIRIRGLSNFEYDEIALRKYEVVKDKATTNYLFNPDKEKSKKSEEKEEKEESKDLIEENIIDKDFPDEINMAQLTHAYSIENIFIVYYAIKDFYRNITLDQVKQIEGISEIAKRIDEKSGRTPEVMEKIKFFREKHRKPNIEVSDKQGS